MTVINHNIPALNAQRNLGITAGHLSKSMERLSSGLRINRAADDAAGLTISEKLRSQISGVNGAVRNSLDGVSMIQTAEGALGEVHGILQRMRLLAIQGANETLSSNDRTAIDLELTELSAAFGKISSNAKFNGLALLTGNLSVSIASGTIAEGSASFSIANLDISGGKASTAYTLTVCTHSSIATFAGGGVTEEVSIRSMVANDSQVLNFKGIGLKMQLNSTLSATATEILTQFHNDTITTSANDSSVVIQTGPEAGTTNQVTLNFTVINPASTGLSSPSVSTQSNASALITSVDTAITTVSNQRATLGALQNALESIVANLNVTSENLTAFESRTRDLDMAAETVKFTKSQILQQAGTAILAQANVMPQSVLSLLR